MAKKETRKKRIVTETGFGPAIVISLVGGAAPYLYVETDEPHPYYGFVKDSDLLKLKDWCEKCLGEKK